MHMHKISREYQILSKESIPKIVFVYKNMIPIKKQIYFKFGIDFYAKQRSEKWWDFKLCDIKFYKKAIIKLNRRYNHCRIQTNKWHRSF
jgi:hypothetical protein